MKRMFLSNRRNKATPVSVSVKSLLFVVKFVIVVIHVYLLAMYFIYNKLCMKNKKLSFASCILISLLFAVFVSRQNEDSFILDNVEALTQTEEMTGALWSNGSVFCCGPGNVRDCDARDSSGNLIYLPCS